MVVTELVSRIVMLVVENIVCCVYMFTVTLPYSISIGVLYPAYCSFKAVKYKDHRQYVSRLPIVVICVKNPSF